MVVIDTGVKGSTRQTVEDVHKLCEDPQYMSHVKHIGKLVLRASDVIEHHINLKPLWIFLMNVMRI